MLGGLGAEIERQADKPNFVDSILSSVVAQAADDLRPCEGRGLRALSGHLLDQLLDTPLEDLKREADKLDTDTVVNTVVEMAGAIAEATSWRGRSPA